MLEEVQWDAQWEQALYIPGWPMAHGWHPLLLAKIRRCRKRHPSTVCTASNSRVQVVTPRIHRHQNWPNRFLANAVRNRSTECPWLEGGGRIFFVVLQIKNSND